MPYWVRVIMDYSTYILEVIFMYQYLQSKKDYENKILVVLYFSIYEIVIQSNEIPNLNMKIP